ncbi:MAG: aspartate aminotransferase family protein [Myxococcota bacterium]|nr:aspartate aminotransferase family protein [Myxococcota bacterium]
MGLIRKHATDLKRDDRRYLGRASEPRDLPIASARGSRVVDVRGRSYVDFQMGWCVGNLGWNHPDILARLRLFDGPSYVQPTMLYEPWVKLAKQLADVTPGKLVRSYRAATGTEAVECALQLAMHATGRTKLVSLQGAYHGNSFGAVSIGEAARLPSTLANCKHLALPLDSRAVDRLDTLLEHRDVAAFIMEPIVLNLGVELPAVKFLEGARELCDRYGTLLIFDEVACGLGRTGRLFASEHTGVVPDIMTLGKALSNGHAPIAATITTAELVDNVQDDFEFYSTYGWHPLAVEAALGTLEHWDRHGAELLVNIAQRSTQFLSRLLAMPWRRDVEVRAQGLALAVRIDDPDYIEGVATRCREAGVLVGAEAEYLELYPALTIDRETAGEGLDLVERAVAD